MHASKEFISACLHCLKEDWRSREGLLIKVTYFWEFRHSNTILIFTWIWLGRKGVVKLVILGLLPLLFLVLSTVKVGHDWYSETRVVNKGFCLELPLKIKEVEIYQKRIKRGLPSIIGQKSVCWCNSDDWKVNSKKLSELNLPKISLGKSSTF